jgi:hypothetical protein
LDSVKAASPDICHNQIWWWIIRIKIKKYSSSHVQISHTFRWYCTSKHFQFLEEKLFKAELLSLLDSLYLSPRPSKSDLQRVDCSKHFLSHGILWNEAFVEVPTYVVEGILPIVAMRSCPMNRKFA